MPVSEPPKVFIDAGMFIAGAESLSGGSNVVFRACQKGILRPVTTRLILREAERNIQKKLSSATLARFYKLIAELPLQLQPLPEDYRSYEKIILAKDAHVLAAAIESKSEFLITLDRKHFQTQKIKEANLAIKICTPKEFLQSSELEHLSSQSS